MICGLVLSRRLGSMGTNLFEKSVGADRSWEGGFVEKGDDIKTLLLLNGISIASYGCGRS